MLRCLWFLFTLVFSVSGAQTLEQFISYPIASALTVAKDGSQIAWSINDHGKRNVFHRTASGQVKQLTTYNQDDGQEITQLTFSPDGQWLLYVRGGANNREGVAPNPASLASGVEQAIWCIHLPTGETFRLVQGNSPVFYPDGKKILFAKGPQIQSIAVEKGATASQLFFSRGSNVGPKFSPDGKEVLFASLRGDHSFIGVYTLESNKIRWIAPEVSNDILPSWSPDGKRIVFIRQPGTKANGLVNFVGGVKFSVWVADAVSGKATAIWSSPSDDGGFAQSYPSPSLAWTKADRILFFSEHQGWNHVYSINPDGSDLKDSTPGNGEVESYAVDAEGKNIYFDDNREDIDRRHIWKSSVTEGKPVAVTSGDGIEMYPALANGELFSFRSQYNASKTLVRYDEKKKTFENILPIQLTGFSASKFVKPEPVIIKSPDGVEVHGQLFIDRTKAGKRPGLVFMHGGPIRQMLLGFHYSDYYINCYAFNQYLASQGYAVIALNFRDGIGYGRDFRRAKDQGPRGASEYQDVVAAGKYLQTLAEVDAKKIGLWGGSYGGYLTAMGLARDSELFKAGVDFHGVHDWAFRAKEFSPGGGWALTEDDYAMAYKFSPVSDLSKWTSPVMLICGDDDRNVLFQETTDLAERLRERNIPVEILVLPDEVHGFLQYESWSKAFNAAKDFFDRRLK